MSTIGAKLKAAREAKGLTSSELATSINTIARVVDDLENDEFKRLPAPIYVRGFIKLYARFVGLDSAPLLEEYAALQARATDKHAHSAPIAMRLKSVRITAAPAPASPTPPKPVAQGIEPLSARVLPGRGNERPAPPPPTPPPPAKGRRFPKFHLPRLRLKFRMPRLRLPDIRISAEAWRGIGMVAGVGVAAFLVTLGVREVANRRSMAVSRDLRLIQEPPAPYLSIPATPPTRR